MRYRLPTNRGLRIGLPAAVAACALGVVGVAVAAGPDNPATIASFSAPATTIDPGSAVERSTLPASAPTTTVPRTTTTTAAPTTTTTAPTTTTTAPSTTVPATLPEQPAQPIAPPPDPRGAEPLTQLGWMAIPKLGVTEPLYEGIRLTTLDQGPGHWPGTAMPGQVGNVVVGGHRTSHGAPFRHVDQLVAGDEIRFATAEGEFRYRVTEVIIVDPNAIWVVDPTPTPTATLFACHPPGSVRQRIIVRAELAA